MWRVEVNRQRYAPVRSAGRTPRARRLDGADSTVDVTYAAGKRVKNIRPKVHDARRLKLSPEEGFVLSRVESTTTVKDLVVLTGLAESRVVEIIGRLEAEGAVEVDGGAPATPPSSSSGTSATSTSSGSVPTTGRRAMRSDESPEIEAELFAFLRIDEPAAEAETASEEAPATADAAESEPSDAADEAQLEERDEGGAPDSDADEAAFVEQEKRSERQYRQIYETVYHPMSRDARIKAAHEVEGADLLALCLDADPQVIHAVLENPHAGLDHARMIALHHRTHMGLEAVAKRSELLKDALVERRLLRNPQLPATILSRIVSPKLILEVYKICIDREIPERSRAMACDILRKKFMVASSDEKASLLAKTEGRCLTLLVNCSLDAHATQILCGKRTFSVLFIQNLARWSATPAALLTHLVKLPLVRRNVGLKKMLLKHPNMPSDVKRKVV